MHPCLSSLRYLRRSLSIILLITLIGLYFDQTQAYLLPSQATSAYRSSNTIQRFAGSDDASSIVPHVVIVGGGVGGLAVASRLASSSVPCKVTILEKNDRTGGRCGSFTVTVPE